MNRELFFFFGSFKIFYLFIYLFFFCSVVCACRDTNLWPACQITCTFVCVAISCEVRNVFTFSTLHCNTTESSTHYPPTQASAHTIHQIKIIGARNRNYALAVCNHLTENMCIHRTIGMGPLYDRHTHQLFRASFGYFLFIKYTHVYIYMYMKLMWWETRFRIQQ